MKARIIDHTNCWNKKGIFTVYGILIYIKGDISNLQIEQIRQGLNFA